MRFIAAAVGLATVVLAASVAAQRDHWTEHLRADVEVLSVEPLPERLPPCGRAMIDWPVHARVLSVSEGEWEPAEITILWSACGMRPADLTALVGRRFALRMRRYMHASEASLPLERQPRWYAWGAPTELE